MDEKQALIVNRLRRFLIDRYAPEMIILYGSTARGDTDEFSDIDIMVIMDVEESEKVSAEIMEDTDYIVHDKHIIIRSSDLYFTKKDIPGTMVFSALSEGRVIFRKPDFDADKVPSTAYENRKRDVIKEEYEKQAREFLEKGRTALDNMRLYRCRDYLRFAAVRMLKAVMVFRDVHPPRTVDIEVLSNMAQNLVPEIKKIFPLLEELNKYCPTGDVAEEIIRCGRLSDKTHYLVDSIASLIY